MFESMLSGVNVFVVCGYILIGICLLWFVAWSLTMILSKIRRSMTPKPEPKEPQRWIIEGDKVEEMFALLTKWEKNDDRAARCRFWKMVEEFFPQTMDIGCHVDAECATKIIIVEGNSDEESITVS